jgi:cytoskeletal protein RodZ
VATPRKRKPSRRKTKQKRRRPSLLLIAGLVALVAGFLVRRSLIPSAMHRLTHREPDRQSSGIPGEEVPPIEVTNKSTTRVKPGAENPPREAIKTTETGKLETATNSRDGNPAPGSETAAPANPAQNSEHEHISASDREQLDAILKRRAK